MADGRRDETQTLAGMALLVRVVDAGSISSAARELGLPKSTVSRRLTALEAGLGTTLLRRSTRALTMTDAGTRYYEAGAPAIRAAFEADRSLRSEGGRIANMVRVSCTAAYGRYVLLPKLCTFMSLHPEVRIDLDVSDHRVGLVAAGVDVAIRMGPIADAALYVRRLGTVRRRFVSSPAYARENGLPDLPEELRLHNAIVTASHLAERTFRDGTRLDVPWRMAAGSMELALDACLAGFGIALLPDFLVAGALTDGTLIECLVAHPEPEVVVSALFPASTRGSSAARALVDHLVG